MKTLLPIFRLLLLFFCVQIQAVAQQDYLTLTGKVTDSQTRLPLAYANVGIVGKSLGTVTNAEGNFIFKIPASCLPDSLKISKVGYQSVVKAVVDSRGYSLQVALQEAAVQLPEIQVNAKGLTGLEIIKKAIAAIPANYDTAAVQMLAFYREITHLDTFRINHIESVLEATYQSNAEMAELKTLKERRQKPDNAITRDAQFHHFLQLNNGPKYAIRSGNMLSVYQKPNKHSFLNSRNFKHYAFVLQGIVSDRQRSMYVIAIQPKKKNSKALATGKLYIDVQTLAFAQWDFELTSKGLDIENNRNFLLKSIGRMVMKASLYVSKAREVGHFDQYQGKWYLKDVQRHFLADVNSKSRSLENSVWKTDLLLTVTDITRLSGAAAKEVKIYSSADSLSEKLNTTDFWGNFNTIPPLSGDTLGASEEKNSPPPVPKRSDTTPVKPSNRENGFTRADTLRGKLTPLRTCYDVTFYDLDVTVDIDRKFISGHTAIRFRVQEPFTRMQVDLYANMQIHQVLYQGKPLAYTREATAVFIQFPHTLSVHTSQEITIDYSGHPKEPNREISMDGGFLWQKDAQGNPWVQVVCQGSGASLWWPCKDHLSDEPDSVRMAVTVPEGLQNISNGRLRKTTRLPNHTTRYEWFVSYPINNYNVTLNIGKYAHLQDKYITTDTLTVDFYVMPYNLAKGKAIFDRIKPMLATLEKYYGKYPFPIDGFTLMESLYPMEHQSAVSFGKIPGEDAETLEASLMSLVWHEVSHEWWGNQVSCHDMADLWIHEAFATYSEGLPLLEKFGPKGEEQYMETLTETVAGKQPIIGVYDVNHIHYDIGDMYSKGALMLYTFENVINNEGCWLELLHGIQQQFRNQTVSTGDIVQYINTRTATDYTYFFDQYLKFTSIPTLWVRYEQKNKELAVSYKWTADVPDFRMPIRLTTAKGRFGFVYPTTQWKTLTLPNLDATDFEVDDTRFYIDVKEEER
jgi:hypothetical protein